jgi:hypothetical protein
VWIKSNVHVYHELSKPQIEEKAVWPLTKGIIEEDQTDLNNKDYIR